MSNDLIPYTPRFEVRERDLDLKTPLSPVLQCVVSTVVLSINYGSDDEPLWYETMVFMGSWGDVAMRRYATKEEAESGHAAMVRRWRWYQYVEKVVGPLLNIVADIYYTLKRKWRKRRAP